MQSVLHDYQVN